MLSTERKTGGKRKAGTRWISWLFGLPTLAHTLRPDLTIALDDSQFLKPLKHPEREIDLDAAKVERPTVEIAGQCFANCGWFFWSSSPLALD